MTGMRRHPDRVRLHFGPYTPPPLRKGDRTTCLYLGRRPVYLAGALSLGLFAFPFFWLVDSGVPALIWLALAVGLTAVAAMYGPQAAFFAELFGTSVRYSGASLGSQLAAPLAGGLAPLIATALLGWSGGRPCSSRCTWSAWS